MSADIIPMVCPSRLDEAWDEHCHFARKVIAEPQLLLDRRFMEGAVKAEARWKRLFLLSEHGQ
jgi:hypothetical protein